MREAVTMTPRQTPTAAVYCRISDDPRGEGLGVQRQEAECREHADRLGYAVGKVYVDNDLSATSGVDRPAFRALLADRPEAVIVWHVDRLVRLTRDLEQVIDLAVNVHAVKAGHIDLSTPAGRAVARTVTAWAQYEGEQKVQRMRASFDQRAARGVPWGPEPFGYRKVGTGGNQRWEIDPLTAPLVKRAYADFLSGRTLSSIAREWNDGGHLTRSGGRWTQSSVSLFLKSPRNAGLRIHRGEVVGKGQWEPIVSEATWRKAVTRITDPARRSGGKSKASYLCTGLVRCGRCGATVRKGASRHGTKYYLCGATPHMNRSIEPVDDLVSALLIGRLAQPDALARTTPENGGLSAESAELRDRLDNLATDYADGLITREQMTAGTQRLRARLDAVKKQMTREDLAALKALVPTDGDPIEAAAERWANAPLHLRRAALRLLAEVWLVPARAPGDAIPEDAFLLNDERDHPLIAVRWTRA